MAASNARVPKRSSGDGRRGAGGDIREAPLLSRRGLLAVGGIAGVVEHKAQQFRILLRVYVVVMSTTFTGSRWMAGGAGWGDQDERAVVRAGERLRPGDPVAASDSRRLRRLWGGAVRGAAVGRVVERATCWQRTADGGRGVRRRGGGRAGVRLPGPSRRRGGGGAVDGLRPGVCRRTLSG